MQNPKTILITGASSGIGHALADVYAAPGVTLLLTGRDSTRLDDIADICRKSGADVKITDIPVTDKDAFRKKISVWDTEHAIDLVIANAGVAGGGGNDFDTIIDINLLGTINTVNPLIEKMRGRKRGQIVFMSSIAGLRGIPNAPAYSTSKVAVKAYGDALYPLLKRDNVEVSVIFPGFIKTPLTDANTFEMPFLMPAAQAAEIIKSRLSAGKTYIGFPWPMYFFMRAVAFLPRFIGDFILMRGPRKP